MKALLRIIQWLYEGSLKDLKALSSLVGARGLVDAAVG
jgi:hypothetical protein